MKIVSSLLVVVIVIAIAEMRAIVEKMEQSQQTTFLARLRENYSLFLQRCLWISS